MEIFESCERYEMVRLPDSLVPTTIFVGNLCEFVTDSMLSDLFQKVSTLSSVPACVVRKPSGSSLKYGFVSFLNESEKAAAILRFHGHELNGRTIKVEEIKDDVKKNRVRVPEKIVAYTVGKPKKTRDGSKNTLRRISRDDIDRLSQGQPAKKKSNGSRKGVAHRLSDQEKAAYDRASRLGFLSLEGTGYRRGRRSSQLANLHRKWCGERAKPQIVLCKASGGRPRDNVIVDLSPLRIGALSGHENRMDEFIMKWTNDILIAAENAGMTLTSEYIEDNTIRLSAESTEKEEDTLSRNEMVTNISSEKWATLPISRLPHIGLGVFEGERVQAKAMAKELAILWEVKDDSALTADRTPDRVGGAKNQKNTSTRREGKNTMKALTRDRKKQRRAKEMKRW
eukprot:scaffold243667_cov44-Attheya_sp.AAC.1